MQVCGGNYKIPRSLVIVMDEHASAIDTTVPYFSSQDRT